MQDVLNLQYSCMYFESETVDVSKTLLDDLQIVQILIRAAFCGVSFAGSTLFTQVCLSQYLGLLR